MSVTEKPIAEYSDYTRVTRWIVLIAVMLGTLMEVIDTSIVNVAIPQMMGNLGVTVDQIGWVSTGYIIANVIFLPLTGWLSLTFGRKKYLAYSMIIFTIASIFCGFAKNLNTLVFFRIVQGAGGAALLSTAQATMMEIFPPKQLGMVQAIYGIGIMVGPTVGPTLGGWITDNYSWPWIFFINIPIGIAATIMVFLFVRDSKYKKVKRAVDFVGIILLAIGLGCLQTVLEKGNREGWLSSPLIQWLSVLSAFGIISFVLWELYTPYPAVNLRVLKNRGLAAGTLFGMVVGFGLYGGIFILPIYLQQMRHYTAQQTGFILLPGAIATACMMPVIGRLVSKLPARNLVALGGLGIVGSMLILSRITLNTGPEHLYLPLILRGASLGFLFVPLTLASLMGLHGKDMGDAVGLFSLSRQIGGSSGIAFLSTFLAHRITMHRAILVDNISIYNPLALSRLQTYQNYFLSKGSPLSVAHQQSLELIDKTVQNQASIKGFEDVFYISAVIFLVSLPLLFFFKKGKSIDHAPESAEH